MLTPSEIPYSAQPGFARTYGANKLTLGLVFPIDSSYGTGSAMKGQIALAQQAESAGFAALWVRDIPLYDPGFGDLGQIFEPLVYLAFLAAQTKDIALGTSSMVIPIRNPLHLAKAATSVDQLSNGRLMMGVASGDRPVEYPAFDVDREQAGKIFREHYEIIREVQRSSFKPLEWAGGKLLGADLVPKPTVEEIPMLITGHSKQTLEWIATHGHGWLNYPRPPFQQQLVVKQWRSAVQEYCGDVFKPFSQSLDIDLTQNPDAAPQAIHLGYRLGRNQLVLLLKDLEGAGVNHVGLNLRFGRRPAQEVLGELSKYVLPHFPHHFSTPGISGSGH